MRRQSLFWSAMIVVAGLSACRHGSQSKPPEAKTPLIIHGGNQAPPSGSLALTASGGSGQGFVWSLSQNLSGGQIDSRNGIYSAGIVGDVVDLVSVRDSDGGTASQTISVGHGVTIQAAGPSTLPPAGSLALSATGGSNTGYQWSIKVNASGSSIGQTSGVYVAGTTSNGTDIVQVMDSLGNTATLPLSIVGTALAIQDPGSPVAPLGQVNMVASGGTGQGFRWNLVVNASGGTIDASTGVYIPGSVGNTWDTIQVQDSRGDAASCQIRVGVGEALPVPYVPPQPRMVVLSQEWIELLLPEVPYGPGVEDPTAYQIASTTDARFSSGVQPVEVFHRHFPECAPHSAGIPWPLPGEVGRIQVIYRIFLRLPSSSLLQEGQTYSVHVGPAALDPPHADYTCVFDSKAVNESIQANQVGYRTGSPKVAYLSYWLTSDSTNPRSIDFAGYPKFQLISMATGEKVFEGSIQFKVRGTADTWGGADLYTVDFSAFDAEGKYRLYVPGVGSSYPFSISPWIMHDLGFTALRALTLQRDGQHGLDKPGITQWKRPPAHLDDAIDQATGQRVDLVGGHMDAGDRGKYPYNMSLVAAYMLSGARMFPDAVERMGDHLNIPESNNGIPDFLDEVVYELDAIKKCINNTSMGGAQANFIRPSNGGYEQGDPAEGQPNRVFFDVAADPADPRSGRPVQETLMVAGAMAMAADTPLMQKHFPDRCAQYLQAAIRAFATFEAHDPGTGDPFFVSDPGPYSYDQVGWTRKYDDELLFASAALYAATGQSKYLTWMNSVIPKSTSDYQNAKLFRWRYDPAGSMFPAFLIIYSNTLLDDSVRSLAKDVIVDMPEWLINSWIQGGETSTLHDVYVNHGAQYAVGWFFSSYYTNLPMMFAYGVTKDEKYRTQMFKTWNYVLGTNPQGRSYITGLGDPNRRPRWIVHEIWRYYNSRQLLGYSDGWVEPPPGIPEADVQNGDWGWWYNSDPADPINFPNADWDNRTRASASGYYPALSLYPAMQRANDGWNVTNEFSIPQLAVQVTSVLPLLEP